MTFLIEWYQYRELFIGLVARAVRLRYKGSVLGVFWTLLSPLMQMLVYTLVFSSIMRIDVPNYPLFAFCSLLPWTWFATSLTTGSEAIIQNSGLIKKIYFPTELLPLVAVTANLINFVLALPVLLAALVICHVPLTIALVALPLVIVVQFVFIASLSLLTSMLNTFYRDVSYLLGIVVMLWFYVTPVLYPMSMVPQKLMPVFLLNPMSYIIHAYRVILLEGHFPSWRGLGAAMALSVAMFAIIYPAFNRKKFTFAEVL